MIKISYKKETQNIFIKKKKKIIDLLIDYKSKKGG